MSSLWGKYSPETKEKIELEKQEKQRKSPYSDFIQINRKLYQAEDWLLNTNPTAYRILRFLIQHMDNYNAVVCSYKVMQEYFDKTPDTIRLAIKLLKEHNFIEIAKTGTSNIYFINKNLAWNSWGTNYKYAEFGAKIIISESEQETIKTKINRRNIITSHSKKKIKEYDESTGEVIK